MQILVDPVVPLEQPVHHIHIFGIDIHRIDGTERFISGNVRADGLEQWSIPSGYFAVVDEIIQ
jgi:hypothetical protein